ncbi:AAA family ATPase [Candidatus Frankia alpina]|uniref:AAA family ATPase n=1 Tax=Candidatus Frankia alpina TaxID=2699483 RepID=UPI0026ABFE17
MTGCYRCCDHGCVRVWSVVNLKGGSSKTTSAAFVAHAAAERGLSVLLVDADPQGSALRWGELAGWELPAVALASRDLHRRLPGIVGDRYELVVIDTPPMEDHRGIVVAAMRAAGVIVVTLAPTMIELDRLPPVWAAVNEVTAGGDSPAVAALLTRTVPRATSTGVVRDVITSGGYRVLGATIPRRESYAQAYGAPVSVGAGPYATVAGELLDLAAGG